MIDFDFETIDNITLGLSVQNVNMNQDNSSMQMDPKLALRLLAEGAVLAITGVPVGTEFGIDLCAYTIGPDFRGVKMIPPGLHYVWCASRGPYGDTAPRVGFAHYFQINEIVVREWDHDLEELRPRKIAEPEVERERIRKNLPQLERLLAPYDYRYVCQWKDLTGSVTESCVERCQPALGTIRTNIELQSCPDAERPRGGVAGSISSRRNVAHKLMLDENDLLPDLKPVEGTAPRFTPVPARVPSNAPPADVSRHAIDCIDAVDALLESFNTVDALIEELQLAFVFFLVGYSVESLAHWRKILALLAHSESAVGKHKLCYMKYSEVLAHQLPHLPEELIPPSERNTVYKDVRELLVNLHAGGLSVSAERLMKRLSKELHWQFEGLLDEDPDEQPVVIELRDEELPALTQ
ncbi:protein AAR2 homolog [Scaptodrosophila lebanonensis]|uniref:Protein AAR2 homolog n=1 Tax=Drosophila lebanonensis TaxID=7225 RepID=A0A6J2TBT1_DROLE|nr:protein AAR2 homolog [Scaptodrosophila lebanonensis]